MYNGVYVGKNATNQNNRVLILGESHYCSSGDNIPSTISVLEDYFINPDKDCFRLFHKIEETLGSNNNTHNNIWNALYFANYVDEICGIKTDAAKSFIKNDRTKYNDELFDFINRNKIDTIFVFGRLIYNSLPSYSNANKSKEKLNDLGDGKLKIGNKRDYISCCKYLANEQHSFTNIKLDHDVIVYGMRHPSAAGGYNVSNYQSLIKPIFDKLLK